MPPHAGCSLESENKAQNLKLSSYVEYLKRKNKVSNKWDVNFYRLFIVGFLYL